MSIIVRSPDVRREPQDVSLSRAKDFVELVYGLF